MRSVGGGVWWCAEGSDRGTWRCVDATVTPRTGTDQHFHTECPTHIRYASSEGAVADDAKRLPGEFADRVIERGEGIAALPGAGIDHGLITVELSCQRQNQGEHMLDNSRSTVITYVRDCDTARSCRCDIDIIATGRRQNDEFQLPIRLHGLSVDSGLVDDADVRILQPQRNLVRGGVIVVFNLDKFVQRRSIDAGAKSRVIEERCF